LFSVYYAARIRTEKASRGTPGKAIDMFAVICGGALVAQHQRILLEFVATQWSSTSACSKI